MNPIDRHERIALQISGGKDSLACLYLLRDYWDKIICFWLNTGNAPPTSVARMQAIKEMVPHFVEIKSNQPEDIKAHGYPVDILPIRSTNFGAALEEYSGIKLQAYITCCSNNLWTPLMDAMLLHGITLIIRGQRNSDIRKGPLRSGEIQAGVEVYYPLENWTQQQVFDYLTAQGVEIPPNYAYATSSIDCAMCTAYLYENAGRGAYLRDHEPELYPKFIGILKEIRAEVSRETSFLDQVIHG